MEWKFETRMANGKPYDRYEYDSAIRMKYSTSKPEDFDLETRAWRAYQVEEVKKVLSKRSYLEHANRRAEALDTLWTKERADSATYGRNWGYYVGLENIRKYYVDGNPFGGAGTDVCHPFTTYKIIIADDNKTATATGTTSAASRIWSMRTGAGRSGTISRAQISPSGPDSPMPPCARRRLPPATSSWKRSSAPPTWRLRPMIPSITTTSILRSPWSMPRLPTPSATAPRATPTTRAEEVRR